ncbi:MAG: hypothetical protein Ta2E_00580 [Mycoplasmoidaceae bacterium]|nr:MAG: hypothetical protein Ta2E_00580 [Mycoplasmoidaceae bacterium]
MLEKYKLAERLVKKLYRDDFNFEQINCFNTINEIERLWSVFKVNIAYSSYQEEKNIINKKIYFILSKIKFIRILLHIDPILTGSICDHVMVITNVEKWLV